MINFFKNTKILLERFISIQIKRKYFIQLSVLFLSETVGGVIELGNLIELSGI